LLPECSGERLPYAQWRMLPPQREEGLAECNLKFLKGAVILFDVISLDMKVEVPTGREIVPTGRYAVPAGKVIIIVSLGRLSLVPTGRVLSPGSDNESDDASVHSEATIP
ncbi:hypothetical protein Tco_1225338, partial [Tanacetum coccineum]